MKNLSSIAIDAINNYKQNKIIMDFVRKEALEKVADEIRAAGGSSTYKAVEILMIRHKPIADRVNDYIDSGLYGCYLASLQK